MDSADDRYRRRADRGVCRRNVARHAELEPARARLLAEPPGARRGGAELRTNDGNGGRLGRCRDGAVGAASLARERYVGSRGGGVRALDLLRPSSAAGGATWSCMT